MANENIQLTLSSKAELSGFSAAAKAVKEFGRANKDQLDATRGMVQGLTAQFGGELPGAVGKFSGALGALVSGGVFGLVGSLATTTVGLVIDHFKQARQAAEDYAAVLQAHVAEGMAAVGLRVKDLAGAISGANKDLEAFVKNANGEISAQAKYDVARLHVETLQKITDGMSESAKGVLLANEAYEAGMIKAQAAVDQAATEYEAVANRKYELEGQLAAAQENLRAATERQTEFSETYSRRLADHSMLQYRASRTVEELVSSGMSEKAANEERMRASLELAEWEKRNADLLKNEGAVKSGVAEAQRALAAVQEEQVAVSRRLKEAGDRHSIAEQELAAADLDLAAKMRAAEAVVDAERSAAEALAEAEFGRLAAEVAEERIVEVCTRNRVDQNRYLQLFNELLEDGLSEEEAYIGLQQELNEELEARTEAERKATEQAKKACAGKSEKAPIGASMTVSLDSGAQSGIGDQVEKKGGFKAWQRNLRQQMREGRDEKNNMKIDQAKMTRALKGEMPQAEAEQWMKYAKSRYTPDQMRELGKLAMNKELLSKSEQQKQMRLIEQMAKEISKALAVK